VYFTTIGYILCSFGEIYGHFGIFCGRFGIFCGRLGILYQEKSGNPGREGLHEILLAP
jgi:hypothetical protein